MRHSFELNTISGHSAGFLSRELHRNKLHYIKSTSDIKGSPGRYVSQSFTVKTESVNNISIPLHHNPYISRISIPTGGIILSSCECDTVFFNWQRICIWSADTNCKLVLLKGDLLPRLSSNVKENQFRRRY